MTYFGVNFYLAGMHSYAAGDPLPVPDFVWISIVVMIAMSRSCIYETLSLHKAIDAS